MIFLDNASTTPMLPKALKAMQPFLTKNFGNPSSLHQQGFSAMAAMDKAREQVAKAIGGEPSEIVFTSGATEANNLAIFGIAKTRPGGHLITTRIEHPSVTEPMRDLERQGWSVTFLPVDREGFISLEQLKQAIRKDTILVSVVHGNHEIGTLQDIAEIGRLCRSRNVLLHTDASQSFLKTPLDVREMQIDLVTLNSHKVHGPKGAGALYVRKGVRLLPLMHGGGQEFGLRPGTENVAVIAGFGKAVEIGFRDHEKNIKKIAQLRNLLMAGLLKIPGTRMKGPAGPHLSRRVPSNLSVSFSGVLGEALLIELNQAGICASAGTACVTRGMKRSNVLEAIGLSAQEANSTIRLSVSHLNTPQEISSAAKKIAEIVARLRKQDRQPYGPEQKGRAALT